MKWFSPKRRYLPDVFALLLLSAGASAVVAFPLWRQILSQYSPDGRVEPVTWLYVQSLIISAIIPGLVLLMRRALVRWLGIADNWLASLSRRQFIAAIIILSIAVRMMVIALLPSVLHSDWLAYHELASTWADTGDYRSQGLLTAYWPPGWPWVLSRLYLVFGPEPLAGYVWNLCLSGAIIVLTFLIARHVWDERHARWTAVITGLLPSQILFTNKLCSEFTFAALFLASVYLALRASSGRSYWWLSVFSGLALGLATLTRTVTALYPIILLTLFWGLRNARPVKLGRWTIIVVAMAVVITPWCWRNYEVMGRFTIATNTGVNLYVGNNPQALGTPAEPDARIIDSGNTSQERYNDSLGTALTIDNVREQPVQFLKRLPVK
ncbi:MAG: hypothetical protein GF341_03210, partial [candidate division Zixibacteria bacterium]|nr:hypothetical protein [candidate division Zixibacteria bacterium]